MLLSRPKVLPKAGNCFLPLVPDATIFCSNDHVVPIRVKTNTAPAERMLFEPTSSKSCAHAPTASVSLSKSIADPKISDVWRPLVPLVTTIFCCILHVVPDRRNI